MVAVLRLGIPRRTLGMGGCGAESKKTKDIVNFIIIILLFKGLVSVLEEITTFIQHGHTIEVKSLNPFQQ